MMKLLLCLIVLVGVATATSLETEVKKEAKDFAKIEDKAKVASKASIAGDESRSLSKINDIIERIRRRGQELLEREQECREMTSVAKRDDCLTEVNKDKARNLAKRRLVDDLEACSSKENKAERSECVKKVAVAFLKLRPVRVVIKDDASKVAKEAQKAIKSAEKDKRSEVRKRVAATVAALYKRLADINVMRRKCKALESGTDFENCNKSVEKLVKDNQATRDAVKALGACRKVSDKSKRRACFESAQDKLLSIVAPGSPDQVPQTVDELDGVLVKKADDIIVEIASHQDAIDRCESSECRRKEQDAIASLREQLKGLKGRFSPRRECLEARRAARAAEFRARAKEHVQLSELHDDAADCQDVKCTASKEQQQAALEKSIRERRKRFQEEWKKLRCPFIAPKDSKPVTPAPATAVPTGDLKSLKEMHERLVQLYAKLDGCDTGECKIKTRNDIDELARLVQVLQNVEDRTLRKKSVDHTRRSALHRRMTRLYLLAADCGTAECRREYRTKLALLTKELAKLDRDELGRRSAATRAVNKYYATLQKALSRCPRSEMGHTCRKLVVHAFRAGTELRQKALLEYLALAANTNAKHETDKCVKKTDAKEKDKCTAGVAATLAKRLAQIKVREMRIEKRRAIRLCGLVPNRKKCVSDVEKEFARDKNAAKTSAKQEAKKEVAKEEAKVASKAKDVKAVTAAGAQPVKRGGSAAMISATVALMCVALAVLF